MRKYMELPKLRSYDALTSIIATQGSLNEPTIIYLDEERVYCVTPDYVKNACNILKCSNGYENVNKMYKRNYNLFNSKFEEDIEFLTLVSKYGIREKNHVFVYHGEGYFVYGQEVMAAKRKIDQLKTQGEVKTEKKKKRKNKKKKKKNNKKKNKKNKIKGEIEYCELPALNHTLEITKTIAQEGSLHKNTIIYLKRGIVYKVSPDDVVRAMDILDAANKKYVNKERDTTQLIKRPKLEKGTIVTNILAKHGFDETHYLYFKGKKYLIYEEDVKDARVINSVVVNNELITNVKYHACSLPELKPEDILTEKVSKCNINYGEIIKHGEIYYRVYPKDVKRAKLVLDQNRRSAKWSKLVKERDNYTCQRCGSKINPHAHHILGFAEHPSQGKNVDNGITLCEKCHNSFHIKYGRKGFDEKHLDAFLKYER